MDSAGGNFSDTIIFNTAQMGTNTIKLTQGVLDLSATDPSLPGQQGTGTESINGGGQVTVSGNNASTVFQVDSGVNAILTGLTITAGKGSTGGGIFNQGTLTVNTSTFSGNNALGGGGIENFGFLTVSNSTFTGNTAGANGGGIANNGTLAVSGSTFSGNKSNLVVGSLGGGGIYNAGTLTVSSSTFSGNNANDGGGIENVITNNTTVTLISSSTFFGNTTTGYGGGIDNTAGFLTVSNTTFSGNSAGFGGGIANSGSSGNSGNDVLMVVNATITQNSGTTSGSGIYNEAMGTLTLQNTIVAGNIFNSSPQNFTGSITNDDGYNLLGTDLQGAATGTGDLFSDTPQLSNLGSYGGPTPTMAPLPGSLAIGNGTADGAPFLDQRGQSRAGNVDIGAFQTQDGLVVTTTADPGSSFGALSLREAVNLASVYTQGGASATVSFDSTLAGPTITLIQGSLELSGAGAGTETINGGGLITISGNNASGVFLVDAGVHAVLTGLTITAGNDSNGGGIDNAGTLTVIGSTFSGNNATNGGGIDNAGTLTVSSSTFSGNNATNGGGIFNAGTLAVSSSTVSGNTASNGGGMDNVSGTLTLQSTIVAGNSNASGGVDPDIDGTAAGSNNLIGNSTGLTGISNAAQGNQVGTSTAPINPLLAPLGYYGGPTQTLALIPGSPAIGKGGFLTTVAAGIALSTASTTITVANAAAIASTGGVTIQIDSEQMLVTAVSGNTLTVTRAVNGTTAAAHTSSAGVYFATDQRGFARVINGKTDIGAFQTQANTIVVTTAADPGQIFGQQSLREAVNLANAFSAAGISPTITFAAGLNGATITLTQGQLVLSGSSPTATATINGGGQITVSGNNASGVFQVDAGVNAVLTGLTITAGNNSAGGGIENDGTLRVSSTTISGNIATVGNGGGIYNVGTLTVSSSTLSGNNANQGNGGGIDNAGTLTVSNSTVSGNTANDGGGIDNEGMLTVSSSTFSGNSATNGCGIFNDTLGTLTVSNSTFSGNFANNGGGGIYNRGTLIMSNSNFSRNSAYTGGAGGGGIYNDGTLTVSSSNFSGNTAYFGGGGGIYNDGTLTVNNSTFSGFNYAYAGGGGGGIFNDTLGKLTVSNSTFSDNAAENPGGAGDGGGINNAGTLTVSNSTFSGNLATNAGGGINNAGTLTLQTSIVAGNNVFGAQDIFGTASGSNNLIGNGAGLSGISNGTQGNQVGTSSVPINPLLAPLGNYGGPTQTMPPLPGSPVLGAGSTLQAPATDQRGFARVINGKTDIGAFQTQNSLVVTTATDLGQVFGQLSLREAVNLANAYSTAGSSPTITFAASLNGAAITLTQGQLELSGSSTTATATINGGGQITVSGNNASRVFLVDAGVHAVLSGLGITAGSVSGQGAGIDNLGTLTVLDDTLSFNTSSNAGGGGIANAGTLTVISSTLYGNSATNATGGGIDNISGGTLTVLDATLTGNAATVGGGIENQGGLTLQDSIVGRNSASGNADIDGGITTDNGNNLLGTTLQGIATGTGDVFTNQPLLSALGHYGGPGGSVLLTLALLPGSPAIAAGVPIDFPGTTTPISTDERGISRPGTAPDIGAFQSQGFTLTVSSGASPQSTQVGTAFTNSLVVAVKANASYEPVDGGMIAFTAPSTGASANLSSGGLATISGGLASVTATANSVQGSAYAVTAQSSGVHTPVTFSLTNTAPTANILIFSLGSTITAGNQSFTVTVANAGGMTVTTFKGKITLTINGKKYGPITVANGSASFTNVPLTKAGNSTISASAVPTSGATITGSTTVNVTAAAASKLVFISPPVTVRKTVPFTVIVKVVDGFGNTVPVPITGPGVILTGTGGGFFSLISQQNGLYVFQAKVALTGKQTLTAKLGTLSLNLPIIVVTNL